MKLLARFLFALTSVFFLTDCVYGEPSQPHVVFVAGDHEYGSERTMPLLAAALEKKFGMKTTVLQAARTDGTLDEQYEKNIPGLAALEKADLAVFYLRWRQLPAEQLAFIQKYLDAGKPLLGFRTTSHAFNYPQSHVLEKWNAFGSWAFGTPPGWGSDGHTHYGHSSRTDVSIISASASHPILADVPAHFSVRSWLYHVIPKWPPVNATPLLMGRAMQPERQPARDNPVAWTWETKQGARSFYTSLGHPEDFQNEAFQRLVINAIHWALHQPVPKAWPGKLDINVAYEKPKK